MYDFVIEPAAGGERMTVRRDGKVYSFGFGLPSPSGERSVAVGNAMIESADLHPLLAALSYYLVKRSGVRIAGGSAGAVTESPLLRSGNFTRDE
jgi:hypothetical protein